MMPADEHSTALSISLCTPQSNKSLALLARGSTNNQNILQTMIFWFLLFMFGLLFMGFDFLFYLLMAFLVMLALSTRYPEWFT